MTELEEKRARLAAVERELSGLDVRHELAMSAFKFDEARDLQQRIAVLERERAALVEALPAPRKAPQVAPDSEMVPRRYRMQRRRRLPRR
jgi:hypothetical protein